MLPYVLPMTLPIAHIFHRKSASERPVSHHVPKHCEHLPAGIPLDYAKHSKHPLWGGLLFELLLGHVK